MIVKPKTATGSNAQQQPPKKTVLVISSHVMTGAVGNRAASFALERLGFPVWEVPTIILPWHPGHGPATRQPIDPNLFAKSLLDLEKHPDFGTLGAILTGYLGSTEQIEPIARLVERFKQANPEGLYVCDPVMGEENGLYIPEQTAQAIKDQLLPRADLITPNRYEFDWLTGNKSKGNDTLVKEAAKLPPKNILITSAFALMRGATGNLLIEKQQDDTRALLCEHQAMPEVPSGTGDMFAALYLAQILNNQPTEQALKSATSAIFEVLVRSVKQGYRDLEVARFSDRFTHPMAMVNVRQIGSRLRPVNGKRATKDGKPVRLKPTEL